MTAEIVPINAELAGQQSLVEEFEQAATMLVEKIDTNFLANPNVQQQSQYILDIVESTVSALPYTDDQKELFRDALCSTLLDLAGVFEMVNLEDQTEARNVLRAQQPKVAAAFINTAVKAKLLSPLYRRGVQST